VHPVDPHIAGTRFISAAAVVLVLGIGAPLLWLVAALNEAYTPGSSGITFPLLYILWPVVVLCILLLAWRNPNSPALRGASLGSVVSPLIVAGAALFLLWRK
jgi:hypothetical protein